jgi:hypothetical protein
MPVSSGVKCLENVCITASSLSIGVVLVSSSAWGLNQIVTAKYPPFSFLLPSLGGEERSTYKECKVCCMYSKIRSLLSH